MPDLIVTDEVAGAAVAEFLRVAPRIVALAGGSTPRPFYRRLTEIDYRWEDVDVLFTDERCVPPSHPDSNVGMVRASLVSLLPSPPRVHPMPGDACDAEAHEATLRRAFGSLRLDLAVLGLGADGHTASLFAGDPALEETERWVARVSRPDHDRLTLTLPVLSSAPTAIFLVSGAEKRAALRSLMEGEDIPAARVRSRRVVVIADRAASAGLA